ncbi:hypothetical protein LJK88_01650 [Paenibacillus sp. P26]|nr:hypothetical protein LJK88_01650 [Paenibacillus sp. P26]
MGAKITILIILYTAMVSYDFRELLKRRRSDRIVYLSIVVFTVYLSLIFAFDLRWPFIYDLTDIIFGGPAHRIVDYLKAPQ